MGLNALERRLLDEKALVLFILEKTWGGGSSSIYQGHENNFADSLNPTQGADCQTSRCS